MLDRETVLAKIPIEQELVELVGSPSKGQRKWRCINTAAHKHGDSSPSLTISEKGYFVCQTCQIKGDIFQLYMIKNGLSNDKFHEVLNHYARKYGVPFNDAAILSKEGAYRKPAPERGDKGHTPSTRQWARLTDEQVKNEIVLNRISTLKHFKEPGKNVIWLPWLLNHYGLRVETLIDFGIAFDEATRRVIVPIPFDGLWKSKEDGRFDSLVNIRKHDILRYAAEWEHYLDSGTLEIDGTGSAIQSKGRPHEVYPSLDEWEWKVKSSTGFWKPKWERVGKVVGIKGHNSVYLYPMSVARHSKGDIWLVGGELKALMMIGLGYSAVTFTSGEGNYTKELLQFFNGKNVRIVYDIDEAGRKGAMKVGQACAEAGANVYVGQMPSEGMPYNGDITDFLRLHKWNKEALTLIKWTTVERSAEPTPLIEKTQKDFEPYRPIKFSGITVGENVNKNVKVRALISGAGVTPFVVPGMVSVKCDRGRTQQAKKCKSCSLPTCGFSTPGYPTMHTIDPEAVVDMTGLSKNQVLEELRRKLGIPPKCEDASYEIDYLSVEKMVVVPTVDIDTDVDDSKYRHQQVYMITDGKVVPGENETHEMLGRIIPEPKNSSYTMAVTKSQPVDGDVFDYKFSKKHSDALREAIWTNATEPKEAVNNLLADITNNVVFKYGMNMMVLVEMLSWFAPFQFSIGPYKCHKVCPEFMILGDTRVGKSTTAKDLAKHLGAGRFVDCGANATFVGLVGGNADMGAHKVFTWGVIPTSSGGHLTMDECNKLPLSVWGGLTNLKSDGVAARTTNNGDRKTKANVRFLTLCNPRSPKALGAFATPLDAAIEVVGTPQDLARVDMLYVAYGVKETKLLNQIRQSTVPHRYERELARYHLRWAWSLNEKNITFANPALVLKRSDEIIERIGKIAMIAPAEAKFKIGRIAVAIAALVYDIDHSTGGVLVNDQHVDLAYMMLAQTYKGYLKNASVKTGVIPKSVVELLNEVTNVKMLKILVTSDQWTQDDLDNIFNAAASRFKYEAQLEHGLMKRSRNYFIPQEQFKDLLEAYINERVSSEDRGE